MSTNDANTPRFTANCSKWRKSKNQFNVIAIKKWLFKPFNYVYFQLHGTYLRKFKSKTCHFPIKKNWINRKIPLRDHPFNWKLFLKKYYNLIPYHFIFALNWFKFCSECGAVQFIHTKSIHWMRSLSPYVHKILLSNSRLTFVLYLFWILF